MANAVSHRALPYPIKGARFTLPVPYLDADGDPTDPTTPDTEVSKDGAAFADCTEEVSTISGSNGSGYITLTGAETDCSLLMVAAKVASGPKATLLECSPAVLAVVGSGTLSAGSAGGGTLGTLLAYDVTGCFIKTTGGTGGGGTGGANNQARKIVTYNTSTGAFTVAPNWETTPDNTTTYEILLPEGVTLGMLRALNPTTAGRTLTIEADGMAHADVKEWLGTAPLALSSQQVQAVVPASTVVASVTGAVGSVTGNVGGNVVGSVGSVTSRVTANVDQLGGDAQSLTDLKDFADSGYDPATNKVEGVKTADALTANNDKAGYSLAVAPPTASAIAEAVRDVDNTNPALNSLGEQINVARDAAQDTQANASAAASNTNTILSRLGGWTGSGLNTILGAFRALAAKASSLTPSDLSTGTTFDNTTDSLEAIKDAGGGSASISEADKEDIAELAGTRTAEALSGSAIHVHSPGAPGGKFILLEKATYSSATGQRLTFPLRATAPDAAGDETCVMHILSDTDDSVLVTLTGPISGSVGSQNGYITITTTTDLALLTKGKDYRYRTYAKYGSALDPIAKNLIRRED